MYRNIRRGPGCFFKAKSRHLRAVPSHPRNGETNYRALSKYIVAEHRMPHSERKSFVLPCGKTVAQTWAALRKSWLGFKIAKSENNVKGMKYYAEFIVKMQTELGVTVTRFDSDLVESHTGGDEEKAQTNEAEPRDADREGFSVDDFDLDYDHVLPSKTAATVSSLPLPRSEIFSKYFDRKQK